MVVRNKYLIPHFQKIRVYILIAIDLEYRIYTYRKRTAL